MNTKKIKLKGHESFYLREGWMRKGVQGIEQDSLILTKPNGIDELGVGANMVKSIRYWLQATGITHELRGDGGKRYQELTKGFGDLLVENDRFFEDKFTLALMHYKLSSNRELATSWYLFFNKVTVNNITKAMLFEIMEQKLQNIDTSIVYSEKSLMDDCNCIIKTYSYDKEDLRNPEDNLVCPLSELGLLTKVKGKGKEDHIIKTAPKREDLDKLAILYVMVDRLSGGLNTTVERLLEEDCNIGKVFNLDKNAINEYLNDIEADGYIKINRTAGLNTIYIDDITKEKIINKYFGVE